MSAFYIQDVMQSKEKIANLAWIEHSAMIYKPVSLFKYFPNSINKVNGIDRNFSIEALKNNTVFLAAPSEFDDPYDCNIFVDRMDFVLQRIRYYASLCGIEVKGEWNYDEIAECLAHKIHNHICGGGVIETLFDLDKENNLVQIHQNYFQVSLKKELIVPDADGNSYYKAVDHVINREFEEMQEMANRFRVACFAQTPYSMLMWSHYARSHQGFCIEYETPDWSEENAEIYQNLFPVIYTDTRTNLTKLSLNWKSTGVLSDCDLWDFYKYGLLSKSLDWKYQQEWRLISCDNLLTDSNYNCKFFKIKKVYLGNKMQSKDRMEVIEICKSKGIPYTGVTITPDQFMMSDCGILCEDCYKVKQQL